MAVKKAAKVSDLGEEESEVPLQAVLLADSFAQKFRPITLERPKVCLSLAFAIRLLSVELLSRCEKVIVRQLGWLSREGQRGQNDP